MTVSDGETEITYKNVELIQQMDFPDGFYLCFRELTEAELAVTNLQEAVGGELICSALPLSY